MGQEGKHLRDTGPIRRLRDAYDCGMKTLILEIQSGSAEPRHHRVPLALAGLAGAGQRFLPDQVRKELAALGVDLDALATKAKAAAANASREPLIEVIRGEWRFKAWMETGRSADELEQVGENPHAIDDHAPQQPKSPD